MFSLTINVQLVFGGVHLVILSEGLAGVSSGVGDVGVGDDQAVVHLLRTLPGECFSKSSNVAFYYLFTYP